MIYAVQAYLIFLDAATRDARQAQAESQVTSRPRWFGNATVITPFDQGDGPALYIEVRYLARSDQLAIEDSLRKLNDIQPGSWVEYHDCLHDDVEPCTAVTRTVI